MARLAGVNIPDDKRTVISLTYIYGVGPTTAQRLCREAQVSPDARVKELTDSELGRLREAIEKTGLLLEGDLRRQTSLNIRRLRDAGTYRGERHRLSLPSRGQRTKTNARTNRGRKMTAGSGRKKAASKT